MNKLLGWMTLFTSAGTLVCCALPALFVALGMGAAFAGLITQIPQLIWISEHKNTVFLLGAIFLLLGGVAQWNSRKLPCPIDPGQAIACTTTRRWSQTIYFISIVLYIIGAFFAFGSKYLN